MRLNIFTAFILSLFIFHVAMSQRPPNPQGPPGAGGPPRNGRPPVDGMRPGRPDGPEWFEAVDTNDNGSIDASELSAVMAATFAEFDKNSNGTIEPGEIPTSKPPMGGDRPPGAPPGPPRGDGDRKNLPPFFFADRVREDGSLNRADFERAVRDSFAEMDKNKDGAITREEARPRRPGDGPKPPNGGGPPMPPNAQFIGAELRFGDKFVKGQPFSAEIVIEDTRRLYDGSTVKKQNKGAVYRDGEGRTRREQPLAIGGIGVVGNDNKPQKLVFINDFANKTHIFLDFNNKIARRSPIGAGPGPQGPGTPPDARVESLGTKTIEGVTATGTRTTFEIPAGQVGNDKPMQVVSERWFSEELQVVIMSRHVDPIAGEHVFMLVNLKRAEPASDMFAVPVGFKVEGQPGRSPQPE